MYSIILDLLIFYSIISVKKSWNDDFCAYYQAGNLVTSNVNIYDREIVEGGYLYSPTFAILMIPVSKLPQITAVAIWYACNFISLVLLVILSIYITTVRL